MLQKLKNLVVEEEGQALTEYGLIISLIALAVIATATTLGAKISTMFTYITGKLKDA